MQRKRSASKGGSLPPGLAAFFRAGKGGFPSTTSYGFAEAFRIDRLLLLFEAGNYKHGREKQSRPFFQDQ